MKCKVCGVEMPDEMRFCTNCGSKLEPDNQVPPNNYYQEAPNNNYQTPPNNNYQANQQSAYQTNPTQQPYQNAPMSVGGWLGRSLIPYIPFVGGIIMLIMLIIWTGDQTKDETFRNWAKAQLILTLALIGLGLLIFVILMFSGALTALFLGSAARTRI